MNAVLPDASVIGLFFRSRPFAVVRRVPSIIVDAVNAMTFRTMTHVGKEVLKGIKPSVTDSNTSASIVWMVKTSLLHRIPNAILRSMPHAVCARPVSESRTGVFASAGSMPASSKAGGSTETIVTALAVAEPEDFTMLATLRRVSDRENAERFASNVVRPCRQFDFIHMQIIPQGHL